MSPSSLLPTRDNHETARAHPRRCPQEHQHVRIVRSWRSVAPTILLYLIALNLTIIVSRAIPGSVLRFEVELFGNPYGVAMPLLALFAAVILARPLLLMYDSVYELGCHHVRAFTGRYSLKRVNIELAFEEIKGVSVDQTLLERFLGVGRIHVWTGINASPEIVMTGIAHPKVCAELIRARIDSDRERERAVVTAKLAG